MNDNGSAVGLNFSLSNDKSFPPASLQTFLDASSDISGMVLADHESQYLNM
jgi:uracil DNA glycosylase